MVGMERAGDGQGMGMGMGMGMLSPETGSRQRMERKCCLWRWAAGREYCHLEARSGQGMVSKCCPWRQGEGRNRERMRAQAGTRWARRGAHQVGKGR